ncbi:hypothetical protein BCR32DRAFT_296435 [Anaeromyces robustus]|uniref:Restriction of telomere capping protein 5 n=1 Tax=Anaeromyces robustus TaxID=1754192 RepID=A0A1Y1WS79_9FUNG|nr:hypothetical protein BCR32DRAFT_296435 [Anaeromyces robustus]|eukprot:ORX76148.1 hypothetical protein BCR32DRAFT_296435 [Anaeromyces robustus]
MATIISGYATKKKQGFKLFSKKLNEKWLLPESECVKALESCFTPTEKRTIILLFKALCSKSKSIDQKVEVNDFLTPEEIKTLRFDREAFHEHLGVNQKVADHFFEAFAQHMYHYHERDKEKIGVAINEISFHSFIHCVASYGLESHINISASMYRIVDIWAHSVYDGSPKNDDYKIGNEEIEKVMKERRLLNEISMSEAYTEKGFHVYDIMPERKKYLIKEPVGKGFTFTEKNSAPDYEIDDQEHKCYITYFDMVEIFEGMAYIAISKYFLLNKKFLEESGTTKKSQQRTAVDRKTIKTLIDQIYRYLDKGEILENGKNDIFPEDERLTLPELQYWIKSQSPRIFNSFEGFIRDKFISTISIDKKITLPSTPTLEKDEVLPPETSPYINILTKEKTIPLFSEKSRQSKIVTPYQIWLLSNLLPLESNLFSNQKEDEDDKTKELFGDILNDNETTNIKVNSEDEEQKIWHILFAGNQDGFSLYSFETNVFYYSGPTILLINAKPIPENCSGTHIIPKQNIILGAYIPERWHESRKYFGNEETLLFELSPYFEVYNSIIFNNNYIHYHSTHGISFGGIGETARLSLDKSLHYGTYQFHPTLNDSKESFTPSMTRGSTTKDWVINFEVIDMEVIGLNGYIENKALQ